MIKLMILDTWILQRDMDGEIVKNNFIFSCLYIFMEKTYNFRCLIKDL